MKIMVKGERTFVETGMKRLPGYKAFYYCHEYIGNLEGKIYSHIDDFILARKDEFVKEITKKVSWIFQRQQM